MEGANGHLDAHPPSAEIRHATVVKCDVVGSTRLKRGLDLDGQLAFLHGLQTTIADVAARHAGHIAQFEGDGALIFFGFPEAREDAPESAVRMGLDLVAAVRSARFVPGAQLQIRVGIASGPLAIIKGPRVDKGESAVGLIIDMAERLRALANPDQVLTCDATKQLAARFFEYEDLGTIQAKGFEDGVRAWRVVGKSSVVSRFEAQRYDESGGRIVGRRDVLDRLSEAWADARSGHGCVVCLVGEAGIGKSRLAKAAVDLAAPDGAVVLNIDCMPSAGNTPLFPIGTLLLRFAGITAGASDGDKHRLGVELLRRVMAADEVPGALSYLAPLFGVEASPIPADQTPEQVRDRTISIVISILRALAAEGPSVVLCEDLHWADDTTVSIVQGLADEISDRSVLMIVTARPEAGRLPGSFKATPIQLLPLDAASSVDLVRSVAEGITLSEDLIRRIVERCEGVPLLLKEVTRSTVETAKGAETVRIDVAPGDAVPTPLQLVVESRLGRLPDLEPIVRAASVLGRDFSVPVLEKLLPDDQKFKLSEALTLFSRHGLFAPGPSDSDRAQFRHVMICEAVHDTLMRTDRVRLHSRAADILRSGHLGTPDAAADVLAHHLQLAERWVECIETRLAASADTAALGAYVETEGHCEAALKVIDKVESIERKREFQFKLHVQLGVAWTGRYGYASPKVEQAYRSAEAVCGESAEAEELYPIIRGLATLNLVRGKLATAYSLSQQGLALAERSQRPEFLIDAMSVLCYTTLYYGRLSDCRMWIERCLALYRAERGERFTYPVPQDAATAALALLPTVAWLLGDAHGADEAIEEGLAHVERLNRDFDRALLHAWIAGTRYTQRRYDQAEEHARIAMAISQAGISEQPRYWDWFVIGRLMGLLSRAARDAAPDCLREATEMCSAFAREGVGLNASYYLWGLALGHARMGDRQTGQAMLAEASKQAAASEESRMNAEILILNAELKPDDALAKALLAQALRVADQEGAIATSLRAAAGLLLRSSGYAVNRDVAQTTLDMLDGRAPYPRERDWMHERLGLLRRGLDPDPATDRR